METKIQTKRAALLAAVLIATAGCKGREVPVGQTQEEAPRLSPTIHMADPRGATQLVSGFHDIEQNAWRWTAGKFAVTLRPPRGSAEKGGILQFKFSIPDVAIQKNQTMSLSASVNGAPLPPETYTQAGEFTYIRDVPARLLSGESAKVEFSLDKFIPANSLDNRELGVIATMVGFEVK